MHTPTTDLAALRRTLACEHALDLICDPARALRHPALLAGAWHTLKALRGQTMRHDHLRPAHIIRAVHPPFEPAAPATPCGTVAMIDATRARIIPRVHAHRDAHHAARIDTPTPPGAA